MGGNIRIAYLCSDVGVPVLGFKGCSVHVREMCNAFAALGANVSIYALLKGEGNRYPYSIIEAKQFKKKWIGRDLRLILSNMNLYWTCRKQFWFHRPHFIYERYGLYGWAGVVLAREFSIPRIVEINSYLAENQKKRLHFPRLAKSFENCIMEKAQAVCCLSNISRTILLERGIEAEKILVTPDGVDFHKFNPDRDGNQIRKRLGLEGKTIVGYVGVLSEYRGAFTILKSAKEVLSQEKNFQFIVIGEGRALPEMENYLQEHNLSDRFTLTGPVSHDDIPHYIATMDIALAPYGHERRFYDSPMKIFEYMAMGKPMIATAQGQIKDIIRHGENGLLMEPDDSSGLAKAILELGSNKPLMKSIGLKARATVETYTWEANARKVLDTYRALVNRKV
jgi:glycosyltransferase involved in cell wall biosynthesis